MEREAQEAADDALTTTRRQVESIVMEATERGRTEGEDLAATELVKARRRARAQLLAAQAQCHDEVVRAAREAVGEVLDRTGRRARLESLLRSRLGGTVTIVPTVDGGLEAVAEDGRTIVASVAALADGALEQVDLEPLWSTS